MFNQHDMSMLVMLLLVGFFIAVPVIAGVIRGRRSPRITTTSCRHCGYDLRRLPKGTDCPECGTAVGLTGPGRAVTDIISIKIPVIGPLVKKTAIARFTRTLGTLISAGVPILEAILITRDTSGNYVFERALTKVHDSIREGETFAGPLREAKVCDAIVVNMIDVGEETGDLDVMLMKIADNYDEEVDVAVASLLSLLEPFMVVVLGGIVLLIVLALFLPLVSMIESVSNTSKK